MHKHGREIVGQTVLMALLAAGASGSAWAGDQPQSHTMVASNESTLDLSLGYRTDNLKWTIAAAGINVLSELEWKNLDILQLEGRGSLTLDNDVYMRGALGYGKVVKGKNQDSDYGGNDRTLEWSRSNNDAKDGQVLDASLGFGYVLYRDRNTLGNSRLIPLLGYSFHEQDLKITNGQQSISGTCALCGFTAPPVGPIAGLNSSYTAQWRGPWVGLDFMNQLPEQWDFRASYEYHWADYDGKGNWNLRNDLAHPVSFQQTATANGHLFELGLSRGLDTHWSLNAVGRYQDWSTAAGTHRAFNSSGTSSDTRFNGAEWDSYSIMLGASYRY